MIHVIHSVAMLDIRNQMFSFCCLFGKLSVPVPVIRGLEAFQFKVRVDSNLVSQGHVFDSTGCLHQLLKAQEFRRGGWNILNNTDDDIQLSFDE